MGNIKKIWKEVTISFSTSGAEQTQRLCSWYKKLASSLPYRATDLVVVLLAEDISDTRQATGLRREF